MIAYAALGIMVLAMGYCYWAITTVANRFFDPDLRFTGPRMTRRLNRRLYIAGIVFMWSVALVLVSLGAWTEAIAPWGVGLYFWVTLWADRRLHWL